jgi:hypothetical protein
MLRTRAILSFFVAVSLIPLLSCGTNMCFTGSSPQIVSVTPGTVVNGSSALQVTIIGSNFTDGTVVIFDDGTQLAPATITPSRMTVFFAATFFNGVSTIRFHLSDGCRGASNTVAINIVENF